VCCSVLQCVTTIDRVLQCVAVCCSVLQCVAVQVFPSSECVAVPCRSMASTERAFLQTGVLKTPIIWGNLSVGAHEWRKSVKEILVTINEYSFNTRNLLIKMCCLAWRCVWEFFFFFVCGSFLGDRSLEKSNVSCINVIRDLLPIYHWDMSPFFILDRGFVERAIFGRGCDAHVPSS